MHRRGDDVHQQLLPRRPRHPSGGIKHSGYGGEHAIETLREFSYTKMVRFPSASERFPPGARSPTSSRSQPKTATSGPLSITSSSPAAGRSYDPETRAENRGAAADAWGSAGPTASVDGPPP